MKKKCKYIGIIICVIAVIAVYSIPLCAESETFRVVEIGEIDGIPISGPMKWAPSSDKIAFISKSNLVVVDTLGKKIAEFSTEFTPRRFEWLSDGEVVAFEQLQSRKIAHIKLMKYDLGTGESSVLEEFEKQGPLPFGLNDGYFEGPYLTVQGNLYYYVYMTGIKVPTIPESKYHEKAKYEGNHIYMLKPGGLYLMQTDLRDSIYAFEKSYTDTVKSFKQIYYIRDGLIIDLRDSSTVFLDTCSVIQDIKRDYIACGFSSEQINPNRKEVLISYNCDIDEYGSADYLFLIDYNSCKSINLNNLTNARYCQAAKFSPDGQLIVLICSGKGYIIFRGYDE